MFVCSQLDYISDSSDQDSDLEAKANKEMKSVAEEDALRKLLTSDEDSEEEKNSHDESDKEEERNKKEAKEKETKEKLKKKKLKKKKSDDKKEKKESLSDFSSDSSDTSMDEKPSLKLKKLNGNSGNSSRSGSPSLATLEGSSSSNPHKRKMFSLPTDLGSGGNSNGGLSVGGSENSNSPNVTPAKKAKYDAPPLPVSFAGVVSGSREYVFLFYCL